MKSILYAGDEVAVWPLRQRPRGRVRLYGEAYFGMVQPAPDGSGNHLYGGPDGRRLKQRLPSDREPGTPSALIGGMSSGTSAALDVLVSLLCRDQKGRYTLGAGAETRLDQVWGRLARKPDAAKAFTPVLKLIVALEQKFDASAIAGRVIDILRDNPATLAVLKTIRGALGSNVPGHLAWLGNAIAKTAPRFGQAAPSGTAKVSTFFDVGMQPLPGSPKRFRCFDERRTEAPQRAGSPARRSFSVG